jgi:septum formation topological specificity factor MinE
MAYITCMAQPAQGSAHEKFEQMYKEIDTIIDKYKEFAFRLDLSKDPHYEKDRTKITHEFSRKWRARRNYHPSTQRIPDKLLQKTEELYNPYLRKMREEIEAVLAKY